MSKENDKLVNTIQSVLLLLLVVYLAYWSAHLTWVFLDSGESTVIALPQKAQVNTKSGQGYGDQLHRYHLFGEMGKPVVVKQDKPKEAPKTRLRLALKGVFTAEDPGKGGAIIEEIGKSAEYYSVGDSLPGNAELAEVYSDRVLLSRNGRLETLSFDEKSQKQSIARVPTKPKALPKRSSSKVEPVNTPEQFINEATQRIAENPEKALGSVGLKASEQGYVYQGGNPMLAGLNLKKGDVIRSVNGHSLGDVQKDKELMKSLYEQGSLEVEVYRDGASFFINYPLR